MRIVTSNLSGTLPSPKEVITNVKPTNQIDAFTDFINEWIDLNVKVFSRGGKHDGEML